MERYPAPDSDTQKTMDETHKNNRNGLSRLAIPIVIVAATVAVIVGLGVGRVEPFSYVIQGIESGVGHVIHPVGQSGAGKRPTRVPTSTERPSGSEQTVPVSFSEIQGNPAFAQYLLAPFESLTPYEKTMRESLINDAIKRLKDPERYLEKLQLEVEGVHIRTTLGQIVTDTNGMPYTTITDSHSSEFVVGIYAGSYAYNGETYLVVATPPSDPTKLIIGNWDATLLSTDATPMMFSGIIGGPYPIEQGMEIERSDISKIINLMNYNCVGNAGMFSIPTNARYYAEHYQIDQAYLDWIKAGRQTGSRPSYIVEANANGLTLPAGFGQDQGQLPQTQIMIVARNG